MSTTKPDGLSLRNGWTLTTSGGTGCYGIPISEGERGNITVADGHAPGMIFVGLQGDYSKARPRRVALTVAEVRELAQLLISAAYISSQTPEEPAAISPQHAHVGWRLGRRRVEDDPALD